MYVSTYEGACACVSVCVSQLSVCVNMKYSSREPTFGKRCSVRRMMKMTDDVTIRSRGQDYLSTKHRMLIQHFHRQLSDMQPVPFSIYTPAVKMASRESRGVN